jgi:mannose-1-phosphate guanylyltransferase
VLVVCGEEHREWVRRQAPWIPSARIITEGAGRNTAASISLAAHWIRRHAGDGTMVVIPSDHRIEPLEAFRHDVSMAARLAGRPGTLAIMGVPAKSANTGFGYIRTGKRLAPGEAAAVRTFVEKPPRPQALRMLARGDALWNSGLFVWRATAFLKALERHAPVLSRAVRRSLPPPGRSSWRIPRPSMARIPALPVDQAVLEKAGDVFVVRATFDWSDLGTFDALGSILPGDSQGNRPLGTLIGLGARDCITVNSAGITVLVGVRDLIVVRDGEAVMVCARGLSQQVRRAQGRLTGRLSLNA